MLKGFEKTDIYNGEHTYFYLILKHPKKKKTDTLVSKKVHMHIELLEKVFDRYLKRYPDKTLDIDALIDNVVDSGFLEKKEE